LLALERSAQLYAWAIDLLRRIGAESERISTLQARRGDALANAGHGGEAARVYLAASKVLGGAQGRELKRRAAEQFLRSGYFGDGVAALREVLRAAKIWYPSTLQQTVVSYLFHRLRIWLRSFVPTRTVQKIA
jgi:hypothetical protein